MNLKAIFKTQTVEAGIKCVSDSGMEKKRLLSMKKQYNK